VPDLFFNKGYHFPHFLRTIGFGQCVMLLDVADACEEGASFIESYLFSDFHLLKNV
jgi:hypothetical protein